MYNEQIENSDCWVSIVAKIFQTLKHPFWGILGGFGGYMSLPNCQQQVSHSSKMGLAQTMETHTSLKLADNKREDLILSS